MKCSVSILLFGSIILCSCQQKDEYVKKEYYSQDKIKFIKRYKNNSLDGESIWFYPSGNCEQKTQYVKGKRDGYSYHFYASGCLKDFRYFREGKEVGIGLEYYDFPLASMKTIFHFNDSGHLFYKKTFDERGRFLSEEGQKPQ